MANTTVWLAMHPLGVVPVIARPRVHPLVGDVQFSLLNKRVVAFDVVVVVLHDVLVVVLRVVLRLLLCQPHLLLSDRSEELNQWSIA